MGSSAILRHGRWSKCRGGAISIHLQIKCGLCGNRHSKFFELEFFFWVGGLVGFWWGFGGAVGGGLLLQYDLALLHYRGQQVRLYECKNCWDARLL
ncbi:hypothetical protein ASPFODRAFT_518387 [Aspergillus luchuensis CBS 106.47]|uniref:Uncharacterized protein n=1 Tax=Aspergillus luchuensis (strain CBS 106.47) TaxID=1137211 RepID=A0A1M3SZK2_ASPLC|nr:hypothetical protein ASPFODRAFT_518387 [Aspergillus luchuensis CBS 106.47]